MIKETWRESGVVSRSSFISGVALILLLSFAAAWWLLQKHNGVLFADLEEADAAAVVNELERMKINYKLSTDGTKILVPQDDVHEIRLKLTGSGLPLNGGVGFELFDKAEFGMTEFAQRINFQRALQGELTRTITSLEEVKYARVHLVIPEASLFQQDKTEPSASITIFLKPNAILSTQHINGIQQLVSASVQGLTTDGVTIVDQYGKTLSLSTKDESLPNSITSRLQKKKDVEAYLTEKTVRVLERAFGSGKAIVSIDAKLNFDQSKTTREEVIPASDSKAGVIRKRETRNQPSKGKKSRQGDISTDIEYRLGRSVKHIVSTPGGIDRLSVGVSVPVKTDQETIKKVKDLVAMAVGLDLSRGDVIAVHATVVDSVHEESSHFSKTTDVAADNVKTDIPLSIGIKSDEIITEEDEGVYHSTSSNNSDLQLKAWLSETWSKLNKNHLLLLAIFVIILTLIIASLTQSLKVKKRKSPRMTPIDREQMLNQLKTWIEADELSYRQEREQS
jgi:flagellar M-ring protein FliF